MGFYAKHVLPQIIEFAMKNKDVARLRAACVPQARGEVLEVGIGSGLNLPFYSPEVQRVYGVDPSLELQRMARKRAAERQFTAEFLLQGAEDPLPLGDESIDTVVMTWTLCSVANPAKVLQQVKRVLKPSGRFLFVEHGRSRDSRVAAWQDRLTPIWKRIGGGCHLNRQVDTLLESAGFQFTELQTFYIPGPRPMTYMYQGIAKRNSTPQPKDDDRDS